MSGPGSAATTRRKVGSRASEEPAARCSVAPATAQNPRTTRLRARRPGSENAAADADSIHLYHEARRVDLCTQGQPASVSAAAKPERPVAGTAAASELRRGRARVASSTARASLFSRCLRQSVSHDISTQPATFSCRTSALSYPVSSGRRLDCRPVGADAARERVPPTLSTCVHAARR